MNATITPRRRQPRPTFSRGLWLTVALTLVIPQAITWFSVGSASATSWTGDGLLSAGRPCQGSLRATPDSARCLPCGASAAWEDVDGPLVARALVLKRNPLGSVSEDSLTSTQARSITPARSMLPSCAVPGRLRC